MNVAEVFDVLITSPDFVFLVWIRSSSAIFLGVCVVWSPSPALNLVVRSPSLVPI
jgi:hypothetical protein